MANEVRRVNETVTLEDVMITFRNFAGKETQYNREGDRNFAVYLRQEDAEAMEAAGWNVKWLNPREEGDLPQPIIRVKVKYKEGSRPPRIMLLTSKGKTPIDEDLVDVLDWSEIIKCDVTIRPYNYDVNGNRGVSAYLQSLYVTIQEDYLDQKYDDVPFIDGTTMGQLAIEEDIEDAEIVPDDEFEQKEIGS